MQKQYVHNEVIINRGDQLRELYRVDSGKAIVMDPIESKIIRVLHSGDIIGIDTVLTQTETTTLTLAQGSSVITHIDLISYVEAFENAPAEFKELINLILE